VPGAWLAAAAVILGTAVVSRAATRSDVPGPPHPRSLSLWRSRAPQGQGPREDEDETARVGEEVTVKVCSECHEFDHVVAVRRTPRDWKDVVTTMANKGASASTAEFATIRLWLTRYYGVVAVNTAVATDLTAVLGLSARDADAVVAYRESHGKFADLDALARVPGLDKARLEEQSEALQFN
jgi:competence protein ComEA